MKKTLMALLMGFFATSGVLLSFGLYSFVQATYFPGVEMPTQLSVDGLVGNNIRSLISSNVPSASADLLKFHACTKNIPYLEASYTYNADAPWSTFLMQMTQTELEYPRPIEIFNDINGDGLLDYASIDHRYKSSSYGQYQYMDDCVLLNNGQGWDIAYRCTNEINNQGVRYHGDCAQI